MVDAPRHRGLLVDWGGVMTSSVFDSFAAFCVREGLEPDAVRRRFASDTSSRELLVALETGVLPEEQFEPRFAEILGVGATSECVFVDDLRFNLAPAAELGMATIHHVETEQTIDELQGLLAVKLR